ncbi:hypothetical protein GCM10009850_057700 [Nonomuraea monospora]|uniref:DUF1109 domain-containing protein n=1 Tax=Nonomuraea monospora TaxID=568818 RepID=A0ABN3CLG5_9ACTN
MLDKPPGWPLLTVFSLASLVALWWASAPYVYVEFFLWAYLVGGILALVWTVRAAVALIRDADAVRDRKVRWFMPWVIVCGVVVAVSLDAPFRVRFALSESALISHAETVARNGAYSRECHQVGLYPTCWSEATPGGGARFTVDDPGVRTSAGFIWSPAGQMPEGDLERFDPIAGPWWAYSGWDKW